MKEGVFEWLRWRFWRVCRCIRRCSSLVNEDARWEPWQGCHYKDEPPLNAPPKHTDLRALYPISHTLLHTIFTLARCTSSTYISQFIAATHLKFFFTFWSSGFFLPQNICWIIFLSNLFWRRSVFQLPQVLHRPQNKEKPMQNNFEAPVWLLKKVFECSIAWCDLRLGRAIVHGQRNHLRHTF